jgi:hypothetical protein
MGNYWYHFCLYSSSCIRYGHGQQFADDLNCTACAFHDGEELKRREMSEWVIQIQMLRMNSPVTTRRKSGLRPWSLSIARGCPSRFEALPFPWRWVSRLWSRTPPQCTRKAEREWGRWCKCWLANAIANWLCVTYLVFRRHMVDCVHEKHEQVDKWEGNWNDEMVGDCLQRLWWKRKRVAVWREEWDLLNWLKG